MIAFKRMVVISLLAAALGSAAGMPAAADDAPLFKPSSLPPPDDARHALSLFDLFQTPDTSPLGTPAASVKSTDLIQKAASFLGDGSGDPQKAKEAAYWLKRAILLAPDDNGRRRAWAATNLAIVTYNSGDEQAHEAARDLWQIAAAWHSPEALCNLGKITMVGDDFAPADPKQAIVWYERAKALGCQQADQALAELKR